LPTAGAISKFLNHQEQEVTSTKAIAWDFRGGESRLLPELQSKKVGKPKLPYASERGDII
jgi:hypothetical protein